VVIYILFNDARGKKKSQTLFNYAELIEFFSPFLATHLATALNWQETLETVVLFTTYDKELWTAPLKSGLKIWPDNLIAQF